MFNDIDWAKKGYSLDCISNSKEVRDYAKRFPGGHWSFLGPGDEEKWYGTHICKPEGKWNSIAKEVVEHFKETGHPVVRAISALNRGIVKRKGGRCTNHFNADFSNTVLLFRTIHSANQLSIHGAVAIWCEVLAQQILGQKELIIEKSVAKA